MQTLSAWQALWMRLASRQASLEQLLRQLQSRETAAGKELALAREEAARQSAGKSRYMERAAELDTQLTRLKAEHRAELAGLASDKKELQTQVRADAWVCWEDSGMRAGWLAAAPSQLSGRSYHPAGKGRCAAV